MQPKWVIPLAIFAIGLGVYLAITISPSGFNEQSIQQKTAHMQWYPQPRKLADFELETHKSASMTNSDLLNKWTLVFVGYTFCPDICPVTLAQINTIYPELKSHVKETDLQVWFLSVDPNRDDTARLNEYIGYFNGDFVASTGPHNVLFPLVRSMGMMYSITESTDNPNYLVDHSGSIAVIDPEGNLVGRFKPKHVPGELAISDADQLLADVPLLLANG
ncbi:MAG: SCO family protein [Pseudomonadota bacterium]